MKIKLKIAILMSDSIAKLVSIPGSKKAKI
jgi:hypothetical protein